MHRLLVLLVLQDIFAQQLQQHLLFVQSETFVPLSLLLHNHVQQDSTCLI